jgi:hypothetical protein
MVRGPAWQRHRDELNRMSRRLGSPIMSELKEYGEMPTQVDSRGWGLKAQASKSQQA